MGGNGRCLRGGSAKNGRVVLSMPRTSSRVGQLLAATLMQSVGENKQQLGEAHFQPPPKFSFVHPWKGRNP